jgi:HAD superfamily hydrolase (TIGR01549 family)
MVRVLKKHYHARPGASELFNALKGFIPCSVYSDYSLPGERMKAVGLDPGLCFQVYGPLDFGAQKPAPRPFRLIAADFGCNPGEVLMVGDRDAADGAGARAAGLMYIRITDRKEGPDSQALSWEDFYTRMMKRKPVFQALKGH